MPWLENSEEGLRYFATRVLEGFFFFPFPPKDSFLLLLCDLKGMQFSVLTKWVLFVALDSKSKIPKSPTQKLNRLLKVAFYHATEVCLWWVRIEFSPSHRPFPTHHCWRIEDVSLSSQIGCYLMLSPHWGSKNLFAVSSFNKPQQTGRKQIYSVRCFLWYGRKKKKKKQSMTEAWYGDF